jgi:hypothetical protein
MPTLLRSPTLEAKPKQIVFLSSWRTTVNLAKLPNQQAALTEFLTCVKSGRTVPAKFYRASTGDDTLLAQQGIMHIHLGHAGTRELLYIMQFDTHLLLLEISDHAHFDTKPPGEILQRLHTPAISRWETEQQKNAAEQSAAKSQAAAEKNVDIRSRLGLAKKTESEAIPTFSELAKLIEQLNETFNH